MPAPKPSIEELKAEFRYKREEQYNTLRQRQRLHETLVDNTFEDGLENKKYWSHHVRRPRAREEITFPANALIMDKILVNVRPKVKRVGGEEAVITQKAQEEADMIGVWLQAMVDSWLNRMPNLAVEAMKHGLYRGEEYFQLEIDPEYEAQRGQNGLYEKNPFGLTAIDPIMLYSDMEMDDKSRPFILFIGKVYSARYADYLIRSWTNKKKGFPFGVEPYKKVHWVEWWTGDWTGIFAGSPDADIKLWNAVPLDEKGETIAKNPYGFVPYFRGFSGLGITSGSGAVEDVVVGLLTGKEDLIVQEARELTKLDTWSSRMAAPTVRRELAPGTTVEGAEDFGEGGIITDIIGRKKTEFMQAPNIPPAVIENLGQIQGSWELYNPGIVRGEGSPGESAVSAVSRREAQMMKYAPLRWSVKRLIANACSTVLQLMGNYIKEPIKLGGVTLKPEDIQGDYQIDIEIEPGNPVDLRYRDLMAKTMQGLLPDVDWAERYMGVKNASDFINRLRVDRVINAQLNNPGSPLSLMQIAEYLRNEGFKREAEQLEERAKAGVGGGSPIAAEGGQEVRLPVTPEGAGGSPTRGVAPMPGSVGPESQEMIAERQREGVIGG